MGAGGATEEYTIDLSLLFDRAGASYLYKDNLSGGSTTKGTQSWWFKRSGISTDQRMWATYEGSSSARSQIGWQAADKLYIQQASTAIRISTQVLRDPSAWYHLVCAWDSSQAAAADRLRVYLNGEEITVWDTNTTITKDDDMRLNNGKILIGQRETSSLYFDGYMAEFYQIDGAQLTPSSFAETNAITGQWIPKDAVDDLTFGTNGFYLPFSSSQLSTDIRNLDEATGHSARAFGNANTSTAQKQFGTASAFFDGTGDYLACSGNYNSFIAPSSDFTIEFWLRWDGTVGSGAFVLMDNRANTQNNGGWSVYSGGTYIGFDYSDGTTWAARLVATTALSTTAFQHYAIVHTGNTVILYVDGTQEDIETGVPMRNNNGIYNYLYIGGGYNNGGNHSNDHWCDCYLDEVRISNIARYTGASITVPTSAFTDDENTQLLMHMDGSNGGTTFTSSATRPGRHDLTPAGDLKMTRAKTKVSNSSIYFDGTGDYLSVGPSAAGPCSQDFIWGTSDWTIEMWIYNDVTQNTRSLMQCSTVADQGGIQLEWDGSNKISFYDYTLESNWDAYASSASATPIDAWYHMAIVRESQVFTMYINGTAQTATGNTSSSAMGNPTNPQFGFHRSDASRYMLDSYLDQIRISNTARYSSNFTAPTSAFTADANTIFLLQPNWDYGFGADSSGNGKNFEISNFGVYDQVIDTPTNNWCTWNDVNRNSSVTLSKGSLQASYTSNQNICTTGTIPFPTTGKWYYEMLVTGGAPYGGGAGAIDASIARDGGATRTGTYIYGENGTIYANGTSYAGAGDTFTTDDITSLVVDSDASKIYFYKNGVAQGLVGGYTIGAGQILVPWGVWYNVTTIVNFGQDPTFAGNFGVPSPANNDASGLGSFALPVPLSASALCVDNLPAPSIALPEKNFNTVLYTGTGSIQTISGVGFQSNFTWIKSRSYIDQHNAFDSMRYHGILVPNTDAAEGDTGGGWLKSWDSDGFSVDVNGPVNTNTATYVAWNWKGLGTSPSKTFTVTVTDPGSGNRYTLDGRVSGTNALPVTIEEGGTYTFDQTAASNSVHPLRFSTTSDGTHGGGTEYTTGVTTNGTPGNAGAWTKITVAASAATLYYYCTAHSGMGSTANTPAAGGGVSNYDGVIPSAVNVNATAGFSIVKYSGSAVNNNTVGHGLSQAPDLWITKCRTAASTDWETFFTVVDGSVDFMRLNTDAVDGDSGRTAPTASVFYVGTGNNQGADGEDYVAYCWHSVEGYSKAGKYVANFNNDGTFIYTGFKPAWIMIKNVDNVANWVMQDNKISPTNPRDDVLLADTDGAEADWSSYPIDILSNGFKMRNTGQGTNGPMSANFLYLAFAESPFKTSNAI